MAIDAGAIYSSIRIRLDQLQSDLNSVNAKLNNFASQSKQRASGFQGAWQAAFTAIGFAGVQAFQALLRAGREAINIFAGFQQSMRNVQSVTGAAGEELRMLENAAKTAGETTRFTARQAADALYFLGSAGFSARQSVDALAGVLELAGATQSDLASTAESVAATISQYNLQASDASRISNVFAAAIANSQATMDKLTNAFRQVGPVAAGLGLSLEQTTGVLQILFNAGFQGQQAGRALKSALADLASPTANITKVFGQLGISLEKVNPETNNFANILDTLQKSGISTAQIIDAFGKVAGPQLAILIKQGGNALRSYTDDVTGTNAATEAYAIQNDSLAGSLDFLRSKLESVAIEIIGQLEPGTRDIIDAFIEFLEAAKPIGVIFGQLLNLILKITSAPLKILTAGMQTLTNIFKTAEDPFKTASKELEGVTKAIEEAGQIQNTVDRLDRLNREYEQLSGKANKTKEEQDRLKQVIADIGKIVPYAATKWDEYGNAVEISGNKSKQAARNMLEQRRALLESTIAALKAQEPLLIRIREYNKEEAENIKKERLRAQESADFYSSTLLDIISFNKSLAAASNKKLANEEEWVKFLEEQRFVLGALGIAIQDTNGNYARYADVITQVQEKQIRANKAIDEYQRLSREESPLAQRYQDAVNKLDELNAAQKELQGVLSGIQQLEKIDPVDDEAPKKVDELGLLLEDFWKNYTKGIEDATREASLFGTIQDELKARINFIKKSIIDLIESGIDPNTITIQKLRMEYDLLSAVLRSYLENEKENIESQKQRFTEQEKVNSILDDYTKKLEELGKTNSELLELERQRAIQNIESLDAEQEAIDETINKINEYYDALKNKTALEEFISTTDEIIQVSNNLTNSLISFQNAVLQNRINNLDKELEETLKIKGLLEETESKRLQREITEATESGNTQLAQEKEQQLQRIQITEEFERKKAELQYRGALAEWFLKVAAVGATAAKAIIEAWATLRPGLIIATTAAGAAQTGAVLAAKPQPPAFQTGGIFLDNTTGTEGAPAILHSPEMMLNADQMKNLFNMINQGNANTGQITRVTVIYNVDGQQIAQTTADVMNDGRVTLDPNRALRV